jgi:hypothetical protein
MRLWYRSRVSPQSPIRGIWLTTRSRQTSQGAATEEITAERLKLAAVEHVAEPKLANDSRAMTARGARAESSGPWYLVEKWPYGGYRRHVNVPCRLTAANANGAKSAIDQRIINPERELLLH